ncbi:MAG: SsrA-binding protein SmpB [Clostridia bacterium]|nr:SsrA-binding protein SmpB [Oscillospiraceae bacterium]MBQ2437091.1 SsrA-binding protein SmpB [Clostridia bacterium]MBQ2567866.1 SsrA-binding protein SmpB [Clostridia bacterium]MBQ3051418.1 SsrA-binding protein SmpB [Clostridia bacterium]MBQ3326637.1 SsrA-binding protein SmpB [Clostridia bacterium]
MAEKKDNGLQTVARNKKAYHDYFVLESFEAGIELFGTEVKSVRQGKVNLKDAWCSIEKGEIYVNGMHISPYEFGNIFNRDPMRKRRLLMHKREINRLYGQLKQQGLTLIPLSAYFNRGRLKIQVGLCKGKKNYDKRESIARKDAEREAARELRSRNNY